MRRLDLLPEDTRLQVEKALALWEALLPSWQEGLEHPHWRYGLLHLALRIRLEEDEGILPDKALAAIELLSPYHQLELFSWLTGAFPPTEALSSLILPRLQALTQNPQISFSKDSESMKQFYLVALWTMQKSALLGLEDLPRNDRVKFLHRLLAGGWPGRSDKEAFDFLDFIHLYSPYSLGFKASFLTEWYLHRPFLDTHTEWALLEELGLHASKVLESMLRQDHTGEAPWRQRALELLEALDESQISPPERLLFRLRLAGLKPSSSSEGPTFQSLIQELQEEELSLKERFFLWKSAIQASAHLGIEAFETAFWALKRERHRMASSHEFRQWDLAHHAISCLSILAQKEPEHLHRGKDAILDFMRPKHDAWLEILLEGELLKGLKDEEKSALWLSLFNRLTHKNLPEDPHNLLESLAKQLSQVDLEKTISWTKDLPLRFQARWLSAILLAV